jgi:hypothetical protein
MVNETASTGRACEQFYRDYAAACDEVGVVPLPYPELLALIETLAERRSATLPLARGSTRKCVAF